MKKTIIIIILFLLTNTLFATSNKVDKTKEAQAKAWAKNQQLEFIENKGQFISTEASLQKMYCLKPLMAIVIFILLIKD